MFESESEGVTRLTAYLQQTKRQAEHSIDKMNQHIEELQEDLETSKLVSRQLEQERDYFRNLAEQLKQENTRKWRLQERDDWKALLESVQEDRERLQEDCSRLEDQLEMAKQLLSPDDLQVFEETSSESVPARAGTGEQSSISRTPPRRSNDNSTPNRRTERREEGGGDNEQPPLSRHRSVVAVPLSRPESPGGYECDNPQLRWTELRFGTLKALALLRLYRDALDDIAVKMAEDASVFELVRVIENCQVE